MENIAPIQIAEPKREKRAAVTAAYRRGYADALEDMRKRQREKKRRRQYFIIQKLNGIALLAFTALAVYILEGDATIAILTVPLALYMIFSREMCIVNWGLRKPQALYSQSKQLLLKVEVQRNT